MRSTTFWFAASLLVILFMLPGFSFGSSPASKEKVIYAFKESDGANPMSDLTLDMKGNLYGTNYSGGGTCSCGAVFDLKRTNDGWKEQVLYRFQGGSKDGAHPKGGVTFDKNGNLFGTTAYGGANGNGTVFKLTPDSHGNWTEDVLYNFHNEAVPMFKLAFDDQGDLLGVTSNDPVTCFDPSDYGEVFELAPQSDGSWTEKFVYRNKVMSSGVTIDSGGNLYGTTHCGGSGNCGHYAEGTPGCGTAYKLIPTTPGNWTEGVEFDFTKGGGFAKYPSGEVVFNQAGHLIGVSQSGGDGFGTVFELVRSKNGGWKQNILYRFGGGLEGSPVGRLAVGPTGSIFGVTPGGGIHNLGTIFAIELSKRGWRKRTLHMFAAGTDGREPEAGPIIDSDGRLYGTTRYGGEGRGVVYEVIP